MNKQVMKPYERTSKATRELRYLSSVLNEKAESFFDVGNEKMSDFLFEISSRIIDCEAEINQAYFEETENQIVDINKQTSAMLSLALKIGEKRAEGESI